MVTTFLHSLRRSLGGTLGWGISLALLGYFMLTLYDTFAGQQQQFQEILKNYPPQILAFFGGQLDMFSPQGFLTVEFFSYMPIILGIFAVLAGSSLLISDEENGTLDLILAHPISRTRLFWGRLTAFALSLALLLALIWIAFIAGAAKSKGIDLTPLELLRPFLNLYALLLLFGGMSLLFSMLLPSRSVAAMAGGLVLVGSYFVQSLSSMNDNLKDVARYLPLHYYQNGAALSGLNSSWLGGLLGGGLLCILLAWLLFQRRDIRVSGEGSWRLPWARRSRRVPTGAAQ
jgi:beta-exotoxin I transport system permease protein